MEDKTCGNRTRNSLDPSSQFQVSYLQSLAQQQTLLPLPMPQTRYTSAAYSDQLLIASSAANQVLFFHLECIYEYVKTIVYNNLFIVFIHFLTVKLAISCKFGSII